MPPYDLGISDGKTFISSPGLSATSFIVRRLAFLMRGKAPGGITGDGLINWVLKIKICIYNILYKPSLKKILMPDIRKTTRKLMNVNVKVILMNEKGRK